ncbi:MAG: ATP-dependent Clp protease adaptor ClpS [Planctomycetota bacterium]
MSILASHPDAVLFGGQQARVVSSATSRSNAHKHRDAVTASDDKPLADPTDGEGSTAVAEPPTDEKVTAKPRTDPKERTKPRRKSLPPWKVMLHNDEINAFEDVIDAILEITPLNASRAVQVTYDAHCRGVSLILTTHRERAELFVEQFKTRQIRASAEPA